MAPGAVVSEVARRHGLSPQHLFTWRRQAKREAADSVLAFTPVVVAPDAPHPAPAACREHGDRDRPRGRCHPGAARVGCIHADHGPASAEERAVIGPTGAVRVLVATKPVDFRKGAEGLAALVRETMAADPFSGAVYVFRAKRADRIKLIFWDGTGVCLWPSGWRTASSAGPRCRMASCGSRPPNSPLCWKGSTGAACTRRARPRCRRRRVEPASDRSRSSREA